MIHKFVYIGWQRCRVYEDYNINRCFKCNSYGHSAKKCRNEEICSYCAGNHGGKDCPDRNIKKCCNCMKANEKYKTKLNINHYTFDENACESYKYFKKVAISNTMYC